MGAMVSSVEEVSDKYYVYFYLVKSHALSGISRDIVDNFYEYATRIGSKAVVIMPVDNKYYEKSLTELLQSDPWFEDVIGDPNDLPPGYIISKPSLMKFDIYHGAEFIYVSGDVINTAYKSRIELSQDIVDLCRYNNKRFISNIMEYSRASLFKPGPNTGSILEALHDAVMLEPNINGLGFKIKPFAQAIKQSITKQEKEPICYDCIIYSF